MPRRRGAARRCVAHACLARLARAALSALKPLGRGGPRPAADAAAPPQGGPAHAPARAVHRSGSARAARRRAARARAGRAAAGAGGGRRGPAAAGRRRARRRRRARAHGAAGAAGARRGPAEGGACLTLTLTLTHRALPSSQRCQVWACTWCPYAPGRPPSNGPASCRVRARRSTRNQPRELPACAGRMRRVQTPDRRRAGMRSCAAGGARGVQAARLSRRFLHAVSRCCRDEGPSLARRRACLWQTPCVAAIRPHGWGWDLLSLA